MLNFRDLTERRVPQYTVAYLGLSWGLVQFISFLERYGLSPHWTDLVLLAAALLIPGILLFAYNHGRPGKDRWTRTEKIAIPLNVLVAAGVLFVVFGAKDLGAVTTRVSMKDETGKTIEREVAKSSYRQRIVLFSFDGPAGDTAVAWLRYGLPLAVAVDLSQDMFLDVRIGSQFQEKLRQLGFKSELGVPVSLKRQIAQDQHVPYFTDAKVSRVGSEFAVDLGVYESATGNLVERKELRGPDVFALVDRISVSLKESLGVPKTAAASDLAITDLLTSSLPALRAFVEGTVALTVNDSWQGSAQGYEQAVAIDPTFAYAWMSLHNVYLLSKQGGKAMPPLQKAMDHLYRLPERIQYDVKAEYHFMKQDMDKAFATAKMKVDLYPEDIPAHVLMSQFQKMRGDKDGEIESIKKVVALDPTQHQMVRQLGSLYEGQGDFENAMRSYTQYAELFPQNQDVLLAMGRLEQLRGKPELARRYLEKALLVAPEDAPAMTALAGLEEDLGNFDAAVKQHQASIDAARTANARAAALEGMASYYRVRGQYAESVRYTEQMLAEAAKEQAPISTAMSMVSALDRYVHAGQAARAEQKLEQAFSGMQPPINSMLAYGRVRLAVEMGQADAAEAAIPALEQAVKTLGYKFLEQEVAFARGQLAQMRGQCDVALQQFEIKRKAAPTSMAPQVPIARCHRMNKEPQKAIAELNKTLAIVPFSGRANYEMALAQLDVGDRAKALEHLERAAQIWNQADPTFKLAAEAKTKLRQIGKS